MKNYDNWHDGMVGPGEEETSHGKPPKPETPEEKWRELKEKYSNRDMLVMCDFGVIDFSDQRLDEIAGPKVTYEEYLDAQFAASGNMRTWFQRCYYEAVSSCFKGRIEAVRGGRICFARIFVSGICTDGTGFDGREDHVWMDQKGFETYAVDDCVSFSAEIYRYIKTGDGKKLDYGLRNPTDIHKIEAYEIPSDDDLLRQYIEQLICEVCMCRKQCYMGICIAEEWHDSMCKMLWDMAKDGLIPDPGQDPPQINSED